LKKKTRLKKVDVRPNLLEAVKSILKEFLPSYEVRAFGSRVNGTAKKYSDLDLAIMSDKPVSTRVMSLAREAFSESDLPFKVDLVDWSLISAEFKKVIEKNYRILRRRAIPV
jgi:predicted nucleotidyltransferase